MNSLGFSMSQIDKITYTRTIRPISNGVIYEDDVKGEVFNTKEFDSIIGCLHLAYQEAKDELITAERYKFTVIFEKV